jgi:hypothetical protein
MENPLFLEDRIPITHSLTFALPPTKRNLDKLNRPDRLASSGAFGEYVGLEIYYGPERLMYGTLVVQKFSVNIDCHFRNSGLIDQIKLPINQLELEEYHFGGGNYIPVDFFDSDNWAYNYTNLIRDSIAGSDYFVAAPVRILDEEWKYNEPPAVPTSHGHYNRFHMYANAYNGQYVDPLNRGYVFTAGDDMHGCIFPQIFVSYVIDQIFGGELETNPFADHEELAKLILGNIYHPAYVPDGTMTYRRGLIVSNLVFVTSDDIYIRLNDFLSNAPGHDLVKELLKIICATLFYSSNSISIKYNSDILNTLEVVDWSDFLVENIKPILSNFAAKTYVYSYGDISESQIENAYQSVATIEDLVLLTISEGEEVKYYIEDQRQYISKKFLTKADPADQDRFEYTIIGSGFEGNKANNESAYVLNSLIAPLINNVHEYWVQDTNGAGIPFFSWYVPQYSGDRLAVPSKPYILFYHNLQDSFDDVVGFPGLLAEYPFASAHNYDAYGNRLGDLSLQWHGDDGLLNTFHLPFKQFIETDKKYMNAYFNLSSSQIKNIDLSKKYYVRAKNFFIEKLQVTIEFNKINPALVDLIEAIDLD